jgi:hypothetical protein
MIKYLLGLLLALNCYAEQPADYSQELYAPNILINPGFENGNSLGWSSSVSAATSSVVAYGKRAIDVDFSSAAQYIYGSIASTSNLKTLPARVSCYVYCVSGTCTHKFQAVDAAAHTTVFAETTIPFITGKWVPVSLSGQSNNGVVPKIVAVAANEPHIYIDGCSSVPADRANIAGLAGSDWSAYTMTIGATTTAPTKGTVAVDSAMWRRVGDSMEIMYNYRQTAAGSAGSGTYLFPLPSGYTADTAKLAIATDSDSPVIGSANISSTTTAAAVTHTLMYPILYNSTNIAITGPDRANDDYFRAFQGSGNFGLSTTAISVSFFARVPIAGWSSNVTMANSSQFKISSYLANGTRVTGTAPAALGEYRSYLRNAAAQTYTETNGSPTTTPTTADGAKLYTASTYASADTNNQPSKYEIFVGKNKSVGFKFFGTTGMTGFLNPDIAYLASTYDIGINTNYDATTGIATVQGWNAGNTNLRLGNDGAGNYPTTAYFDIVVSENALAVGMDAKQVISSTNNERIERVTFGGASETPSACTSTPCTMYRSTSGISSVTRSATGTYAVNFVSGTFSAAPTCIYNSYGDNSYARSPASTPITNTTWSILVRDTNTQSNADSGGHVICMGPM